MNILTILAATVQRLLAGIAVVAVAATSVSASADNAWGNYHWARTANPFVLQVIDSVSANWNQELAETVGQWSQATPLDMMVTGYDDNLRVRKRCPMVQGKIRVCNAAYGYNGWLGLATINIDSQLHITRGTAKVNDSYSSYWQDPAEKNHVMCQEVGHLLGLNHTSEDGSSQATCMDYSSDPSSQWPNTHDYAQLASMYSHLDSYNSYSSAASPIARSAAANAGGGSEPPCNGRLSACREPGDESPWGVRVHRDRSSETWVAPGANGSLWIRHVWLAPEQQDKHN